MRKFKSLNRGKEDFSIKAKINKRLRDEDKVIKSDFKKKEEEKSKDADTKIFKQDERKAANCYRLKR